MINDLAITLVFIIGFLVSHQAVSQYQSKVAKKEGIENYSVHVVFPQLDQIKEKKVEEKS